MNPTRNEDKLACSKKHPCEHSRINILQWILTKLGIYLVLKRIWNTIDFQGQRSMSLGQHFRRGDTPRFVLPLFTISLRNFVGEGIKWIIRETMVDIIQNTKV
jgi:hypothetical protein